MQPEVVAGWKRRYEKPGLCAAVREMTAGLFDAGLGGGLLSLTAQALDKAQRASELMEVDCDA